MSGPSPGWCSVTCDTCGIESPRAVGWKKARAVAKAEGWSRVNSVFRCAACRVNRPRTKTTYQVGVGALSKEIYEALLVRSIDNSRTMAAEVREILKAAL